MEEKPENIEEKEKERKEKRRKKTPNWFNSFQYSISVSIFSSLSISILCSLFYNNNIVRSEQTIIGLYLNIYTKIVDFFFSSFIFQFELISFCRLVSREFVHPNARQFNK